MDHHPTIFDALIQRGFVVFQKLQLVIYASHFMMP